MLTEKSKILVLLILAVSFLGYSAVLYTNSPAEKGVNKLEEELALKGILIWQEKNCTSCHQIYGLGGHLGPDLTNVSSKYPDEAIEVFLKHGTQVMPNFNLTRDQMDALVAFLKTVNKSGKADPRTFKQNFDGTISK